MQQRLEASPLVSGVAPENFDVGGARRCILKIILLHFCWRKFGDILRTNYIFEKKKIFVKTILLVQAALSKFGLPCAFLGKSDLYSFS